MNNSVNSINSLIYYKFIIELMSELNTFSNFLGFKPNKAK